jgi:hypothetical protein
VSYRVGTIQVVDQDRNLINVVSLTFSTNTGSGIVNNLNVLNFATTGNIAISGSPKVQIGANDVTFVSTGHVRLPIGTTAQRTNAPASGMIRYNTSTGKFEGYTTTWGAIGGGATGGGADEIFWENGKEVTANYTITLNKNAMTAGPVSLANGAVVTVPDGSTWTIV